MCAGNSYKKVRPEAGGWSFFRAASDNLWWYLAVCIHQQTTVCKDFFVLTAAVPCAGLL
jgi:hypothetical protein